MRMMTTFLIAALATAASALAQNASVKIDPALQEFARNAQGRWAKVLVMMADPALSAPKPMRYQRRAIHGYLTVKNMTSWNALSESLRRQNATGVQLLRAHWINNAILAQVNVDGLRSLASAPGVRKIYLNRRIFAETPVYGQLLLRFDPAAIPYDFIDTGLDRLMREDPSITGSGVVIGSIDTGVDGKHPALSGKVIRFLDGKTRTVGDPYDASSHGTHTAGTMVGGDRAGTLIGMAPEAKLVASAALVDYDTMLFGMEWMLDPDGNPQTQDIPRAVNNSWNAGGAPDMELFYKAIDAWEAAGILPVFSAGNGGPSNRSITPPHEHPMAFAVGATSPNGRIASFSSRGPGVFHGKETEKPDVTAPGEKIRSSLPGGQYGELSGTSMAAPHVTGATALVLQVEPALTPAQVRGVFISTAKAMAATDANGWNNVYGHGKLDVYAAVHAAIDIRNKKGGSGFYRLADMFGMRLPETLRADLVLSQGEGDVFAPEQYESDEGDWITADQL